MLTCLHLVTQKIIACKDAKLQSSRLQAQDSKLETPVFKLKPTTTVQNKTQYLHVLEFEKGDILAQNVIFELRKAQCQSKLWNAILMTLKQHSKPELHVFNVLKSRWT